MVNLSAQDAAALNATYVRNTAFDRAGYQAYTYQETTSNRYVVALVKAAGSAKAAMVLEAGQFADSSAGGTYARADVFSLPATGLGEKFNYSGSYAGMITPGIPAPGGPGGGLNPSQPYFTEGRALITADFTEMEISGGVDQRVITNPPSGPNPNLPNISLKGNKITSDGTFAGDVFQGSEKVGDYAGLFAGIDARDVATLLVFKPSGDITEHGLIVLSNCAAVGGPACP